MFNHERRKQHPSTDGLHPSTDGLHRLMEMSL